MNRRQEPKPESTEKTEAQEAELVEKLPDRTDPAQERGERIATGKAIATGGLNKPRSDEKSR